jgi:hypothetical protein
MKTLIVAPLASHSCSTSFRLALKFDRMEGVSLLDQLWSIDTTQLVRRGGAVDDNWCLPNSAPNPARRRTDYRFAHFHFGLVSATFSA